MQIPDLEKRLDPLIIHRPTGCTIIHFMFRIPFVPQQFRCVFSKIVGYFCVAVTFFTISSALFILTASMTTTMLTIRRCLSLFRSVAESKRPM